MLSYSNSKRAWKNKKNGKWPRREEKDTLMSAYERQGIFQGWEKKAAVCRLLHWTLTADTATLVGLKKQLNNCMLLNKYQGIWQH